MPVSETEATTAGKDAYTKTLTLWATNFKAVAQNQKKLPLGSVPPMFKNAAAIGLGMNAAKIAFPDSVITKAATATFAVPLTMVNSAMTAFKKEYADTRKRENLLLNSDYEHITYLFCNELDAAKGPFYESPMGIAMSSIIRDIAQKLRHQAATPEILMTNCKKAVEAIIDPRTTTAETNLNAGFTPMCQDIHAVYSAWHDSQNGMIFKDVLIRLHPDKLVDYTRLPGGGSGSDFFRTLRSPIPTRLLNPIPEKNEYTTRGPKHEKVDKRDDLNWVLANIWNLEVELVPYLTKGNETYVWPINEPAPQVPSISQVNIADVKNLMYKAVGLA